MAKKWMVTAGAIALGVSMLVGNAFAQNANASGYDVMKEVIKNKSMHRNLTADVKVKVEDNNQTLLSGSGVIKVDHAAQAMSGKVRIAAGKGEASADLYCSGGKLVVKADNSDVYKVFDHKEMKNNRSYENCKMPNSEDALKFKDSMFDMVFGGLKDYVKLENSSDGNKIINLDMAESNIPACVNTLAALGMKHSSDKISEHKKMNALEGCKIFESIQGFKHPELVNNISIKEIHGKAVVNKDNEIISMSMSFTIRGEDSSGAVHEIKVSADVNLSDIGSTVPEKIDLNGKKVETITSESQY